MMEISNHAQGTYPMADAHYQVTVSGQLMPGAHPDEVRLKVAQLFKASVDTVRPLLSGQRVSVKKGLDEATARKYEAALRQAGLVAEVEAMAAPQPAPATGILASTDLVAPTGTLLDQTPPPPPADINTAGLGMAAAGERIIDYIPPPEPVIDISRLGMDQAGVVLVEAEIVAPPVIPTDGLDLADRGEPLDQRPRPAEPEIDISALKIVP